MTRVAVVYGGPSAEAQVSRVSGGAVHRALTSSGHDALLLELDRRLAAALADHSIGVVVPTTHGPLGEDGCLQGLLEVMNIPYAGSGVLASALAANKAAARSMFQQAGLPVAAGTRVTWADRDRALARKLRAELGRALVVKPVSGGSAIGVGRVKAEDEDEVLEQALEMAFTVDRSLVVEAFSLGDEVTCGVLEDADGVSKALPPTRIIAKAADWYDFKSRYGTNGSEHQCPAPYAPELIEKIQQVAVQAHRALGARDLSRVDFIVDPDAEELTLLEVNTLPGMTPTSLFPEAAGVSGVDFSTLCGMLVSNALKRGTRISPSVQPMPD